MDAAQARDSVSLVAANFGNPEALADVLDDWFTFLGGKPGEVVIVDGGSDPATQRVYWDLFSAGKIDKLQVIRGDHPENNKNLCFIQEHTAGAIASRPYLLWFKSDTLPFRQGHDNWLAEAIDYLDRDDTFAVGGSFNIPSKHHDAWPGWYFSDKCSENFALMKRDRFIAAMREMAGDYIASGFRGPSPSEARGQSRYLIEVAFERFIEKHGQYTLVKVEDPTWTVFHTNLTGPRLARARQNYLARIDIQRHMNAGSVIALNGGCYYGMSRPYWKEMRVALGASPLGGPWRKLKKMLGRG
jgi:hypothetical protein